MISKSLMAYLLKLSVTNELNSYYISQKHAMDRMNIKNSMQLIETKSNATHIRIINYIVKQSSRPSLSPPFLITKQ